MDLSFDECKVALAACNIAAQHEEERASQMIGPAREAVKTEARRFRALADRLAQVKGPDDRA